MCGPSIAFTICVIKNHGQSYHETVLAIQNFTSTIGLGISESLNRTSFQWMRDRLVSRDVMVYLETDIFNGHGVVEFHTLILFLDAIVELRNSC